MIRLLLAAVVGTLAFVAAVSEFEPGLWGGRRALRADDDAAIRAMLVEYQRIYQDFFASGGAPALLDAFPASKGVRHQVFKDIGFVRDAGLVLVQDLATLDVREITPTGPRTAEATTFEEWNHVFQLAEGRTPASRLKGMGQGFRYMLRREAKGWVVTGWDLVDLATPAVGKERTW